MATTFKTIASNRLRRDGLRNLQIRVTHNRQTLRASTHLYAGPGDLTRGLKLKNQEHIDKTDDMIRRWRGIVADLGIAADVMTVKQVIDHIKTVERTDSNFRLDFIAYGHTVASRKNKGTGGTYTTALNCLERYQQGKPLDISKITVKYLEGFENFIRSEPTHRHMKKSGILANDVTKAGRAVSLYISCIRHIHNMAKSTTVSNPPRSRRYAPGFGRWPGENIIRTDNIRLAAACNMARSV